ncbi:gamma-glutamylcyclotransferase family protein [Streptoverticillium reticulum]|uniref:gamma-glutamylcyclotransferase family protein n=1 Tax=Streptoverticillium reticulum TaxID=1433415 RepID=UPI0039BFFAD8
MPDAYTAPSAITRRSDRLAPGADALFVYGTLQFSQVLDALLGRIPASTPAFAEHWRAAALERRVYPGLVPAPGRTVPGLLLTDLTQDEVRALDDFEDDAYDLRCLPLTDGRFGWAYVWPGHEVLEADWSFDRFADRHLAAYAARCASLAAARSHRADHPESRPWRRTGR